MQFENKTFENNCREWLKEKMIKLTKGFFFTKKEKVMKFAYESLNFSSLTLITERVFLICKNSTFLPLFCNGHIYLKERDTIL